MPDVITKTIRATGGDFTTLTAWAAAIPADLLALDEQWIAECYNDWPSGLVDSTIISGITTDATRNIIIRSAENQGSNGIVGSGFRLVKYHGYAPILYIQNDNVIIENIEVENTHSAGRGISSGAFSKVVLKNCISKAVYVGYSHLGTGTTVINCLAYNSGTGFQGSNWSAPIIRSSIAAKCTNGFSSTINGQAISLKNCIGYLNTNNYVVSGVGFTGGNNAASDSTTNTPPGANPYLSDVVSGDFVDSPNNDYHLSVGSALIGQGVNLYTDFTKDVDGDDWPSSGAWNIGFDFIPSSSGITGTGILSSSNSDLLGIGLTTKKGIGALSSITSSLQGTGVISGSISGSGVLESTNSNLNGVGVSIKIGSGNLSSSTSDLDGIGVVAGVITGLGVLSSQDSSLSGQGFVTVKGIGDLSSTGSTLSGVGVITGVTTGSGTLISSDSDLSGTGVLSAVVSGSGSLGFDQSILSGSGVVSIKGTGSLSFINSELSGIGNAANKISGTGVLLSDESILSGEGNISIRGNGTLYADNSKLTGFGDVGGGTLGSGNLSSAYSILSGSGVVAGVSTGSGVLYSDLSSLVGFGKITVKGAGSLSSVDSFLLGQGRATIIGSGILNTQLSNLFGRGGVNILENMSFKNTIFVSSHNTNIHIKKINTEVHQR